MKFSPLNSVIFDICPYLYYFRFEKRVTDENDKDKIAGEMKFAIKNIKTSGGGAIDHNSEEGKFAEEITCEFFGDYSGITPPLNLAQAKDTILEIEKDKDTPNSDGVPIKVTLTPLSTLTNATIKMVNKLSASAVNDAARLLQDIEDIQVSLKTLENSKTSQEYKKYKTRVVKIKNIYENRGSELKSNLSEILTKIKGSNENEQRERERELTELIKEYDESPFGKANTLEWLDTLESEVIYVDHIIDLAKEKGVPVVTKNKFDGEKTKAAQGMLYFEATFVSCLQMTGKEKPGEVNLRSTGSVQDDEAFKAKFNRQWLKFTTAISDGGLRNDDAKVKTLFYLEFMAEENQCDTKFYEMGYDSLSETNTDAEVGSVKYESHDNTVTGVIRPRGSWMDDTCPVAAKGGFISIQLRYTEDKAEAEERSWDKKHEAEKTSFKLDLGQLHGLHAGSQYSARLRYQIR